MTELQNVQREEEELLWVIFNLMEEYSWNLNKILFR